MFPVVHFRVSPVVKKKGLDPEAFKDYRPITNFPFLSKVIKTCVLSLMYSYLLQNDLFPTIGTIQSAYRKDNSTETALLRIINDILQAFEKHEDIILVLLDLSAAFDTIIKCYWIGYIRDLALEIWLFNGLLRTQRTANNQSSIESVVLVDSQLRFGVPSGSVQGPVLLSMYVATGEGYCAFSLPLSYVLRWR